MSAPPARTRRLIWLGVAALVGLIALTAALDFATPAPEVPIDAPVNDYADVLSPAAEAHLEATLRQLYGGGAGAVQMAVLTIPSTHGEPIEDFSYRVASAWAGGEQGRDNGVLLTLAIQDRRIRLEVGRGLEDVIPDHRAAGLIESMKQHLRRDDYARAIAHAIWGVAHRTAYRGPSPTHALPDDPAPEIAVRDVAAPSALRVVGVVWGEGLTAARGVLGLGLLLWLIWLASLLRARLAGDPAATARRFREDKALVYGGLVAVTGALLVAGGVAAFNGASAAVFGGALTAGFITLVGGSLLVGRGRDASFAHWRRLPRPCPHGDGMMRLLSAEDAEPHLDPGERTEHAIMSRIHDVWWCPGGHHHRETYPGDAPADDCLRCHNATLHIGAWQTEIAATYSHGGRDSRTDECAHCGEIFTRTRSTPKRTRSSSSGGGWSGGSSGGGWSGGGGSFGGGGASGSW